MPSVSQSQQRAAALALSAKRGKVDPKTLKGAAKQMYDSMSEKQLKEFAETKRSGLPEKKEEESSLIDNDILTEAQKVELRKIIDTLVEEQVQKKNREFIEKYTKFIAESATTKLVEKVKGKLLEKIDEEIKTIHAKADKICRSVILESSTKVRDIKRKQEQLIEEFKNSAPKLIKSLAEEKVKELAADALVALNEKQRLEESLSGIFKGMEKAGYIINEDLDHVIAKEKTEKLMLRTKLALANRDLKLSQLTEGMLPTQKRAIEKLLEDCTTPEMIEERFLLAKKKVMESKVVVEEVVPEETKRKIEAAEHLVNEEEMFSNFLGVAKRLVS